MLDVLFLLVGFYLLAKGADALVEGAATLATRWGMDRWVVGLTVVAWGTSLPEVVVSGLAAHAGSPGQAHGRTDARTSSRDRKPVVFCYQAILPATSLF